MPGKRAAETGKDELIFDYSATGAGKEASRPFRSFIGEHLSISVFGASWTNDIE